MLELKNIVKDYFTQGEPVHALKGISINFRKNEFVSILGPSGCGKTTLLNIIGGLDRYTNGDLIINDRSTKDYTNSDWDAYRNHSIGFVFQSYNLIPHQTILENVEIALTLSGVHKSERKKRAIEALEKVGLGDRITARPNQLSGGQMQRVAIARALVNNPDILLADEPTGALDSKTSVQVINLLKEVSKEKLVIMVTHNPKLAEEYSTRIISLADGEITNDTNPYNNEENNKKNEIETKDEKVGKKNKPKKIKKTSMSFFTALSLSLKNLLTKKARTILVAFAGSIGIIGIATILAISSGFKNYIKNVEEDTLSTYPITIQSSTIDMTDALIKMRDGNVNTKKEPGTIGSNDVFVSLMNSITSGAHYNNLNLFNQYMIENEAELTPYISNIKKTYGVDLNIYSSDTTTINQVNPSEVFINAFKEAKLSSLTETMMGNLVVWSEMIDNRELLSSQYDIVSGSWPKNYNEVVLVVDENENIPDFALYAIGLKSEAKLVQILEKIKKGEEIKNEKKSYTYDELMNLTFKVVLESEYYQKNGNGYIDMSQDDAYMRNTVNNGVEIKIVGIIKPNKDAVAQSINGVIAYQSSLVTEIIDRTDKMEIVKTQKENPEINVFTGAAFKKDEMTIDQLKGLINMFLTGDEKEEAINYITMLQNSGKTDKEIIDTFKDYLKVNSDDTYESNLKKLGVCDKNTPTSISLYPIDFASKDAIIEFIDKYNDKVTLEGNPQYVIKYTDYIGIVLSSISDIIDAISYVLFAFVAISLVVSSIMIGIITYISVLERIKEIGILRSVGASKLDISRVFNAETMIIGFASGVLGILLTLLLLIPINLIINALADISNVAKLPVDGALILIVISILLSLIAGIIPSMLAAKKNPVECLRSE